MKAPDSAKISCRRSTSPDFPGRGLIAWMCSKMFRNDQKTVGHRSPGAIRLISVCIFGWIVMSGFIPQGNQIVDRMLVSLGGCSALKIIQEITNPDRSTATVTDSITFQQDGTANRSRNGGQAIPLFSDDSMNRMELGAMLPWCRNRVSFSQWALRMGLQLEKSALWRFEGKPVWILGASKADDPVTQLWVDVDSFLPVRLIVSSDGSQQPNGEIRFSDWKMIQGIHYPYAIQISRQGFVLQDIRVQQIDAQPETGTKPADGQSGLVQPESPDAGYQPSEALKPVHQAIEELKQRVAAPSPSAPSN